MNTSKASHRLIFATALLALAPTVMAHNRALRITSVDALYAAVNDPANRGRTLQLAPGTYVLTTSDANGIARPNGGRLELQPDMTLQGREGDRKAVVIDAFNLPAASFPQTVNGVNTGPNAAIRIGLGHNALEWLTVRDARFAQANIDTGLQAMDPDTAYVRIAHVDSSGSTRGLNVLNFGPQTSGQTIEAEIIDCDFHDNTLNLSEGVRIGNFQGARRSVINVRMSGNESWGQKQGRLIVNNRANESTVNLVSIDNRFHDNGGGTIIAGGLSSNNTRADYNTINFRSSGDRFTGNRAATDLDHGGLVVLGTEDTSAAGGGSFNAVNVELWRVTLDDNDTADLRAIGARTLSAATAVNNQGNRVTLEIHDDRGHDHGPGRGRGPGAWNGHGQDDDPVETFDDSLPADPNYGNSVEVIRCRDGGHHAGPFDDRGDWHRQPAACRQ